MPRMSQNVAVNRGRVRAWSGAVVGLISVASLAGAAHAQNVVTDFVYTNATNTAGTLGTWTYGQVATTTAFVAGGYTFTPYTVATANDLGFSGLDGRALVANQVPVVAKNDSGSTIVGGSLALPTTQLLLHPGSTTQVSIVRFIAAAAGTYTFTGDYQGVDTGNGQATAVKQGTTTTDYITANSAASTAPTAVINATTSAAGVYNNGNVNFSQAFTLAAGGTVDFAVTDGGNGYSNDSTGLAANVSFVASSSAPEPGALALIVPGMLGIVGIARRRKMA